MYGTGGEILGQQISRRIRSVQLPTEKPVAEVVGGNTKAVISWSKVKGASKYQVFRTEGSNQCGQGKVLLATLNKNVRTYTDEGLANRREYYYIVIPKGSNEACWGPSSDCAAVTPAASPGIELECGDTSLIIPSDGQTSSTEQFNCVLYGAGGFSGKIKVDCNTSVSGITCASSSSTVAVSKSVFTVIVRKMINFN